MKTEDFLFSDFYQQYKDKIYRLCRIMVFDKDYTDDLVQEASINVWKSLPGFKGESKVDTWIYRVIVNTSITFNSKQRLFQKHTEAFSQESSKEPYEKSDLMDKISDAVSYLEESEKVIIGLYLEGFSYKEISQILEISISNVGVKVNRIKQKLKNIINH